MLKKNLQMRVIKCFLVIKANTNLKKNVDFQSAREILMKKDYKMVVKRRFERIYNMMECKSYMKNEDIP